MTNTIAAPARSDTGELPLPRTVLPALSVERSSPPGTDPGACGRLTRSQMNESLSQMNESFVAVCFPRDDPGFAERVQILFEGSHSERPFEAAVQALLRETYPLAVITPRHGLAALDGRRVWYAFRDGSAIPNGKGDTS
jgi:hypothetical protein